MMGSNVDMSPPCHLCRLYRPVLATCSCSWAASKLPAQPACDGGSALVLHPHTARWFCMSTYPAQLVH
jgi:hypothetical protein